MGDNHEAENAKRLQQSQQFWDSEADAFDNEPDHGLRDPKVFTAWTTLFQQWLPPTKSAILDIGCGTGSVSILLAALGYDVTGIDLSPVMLSRAETKAKTAGYSIVFRVMDAAFPELLHQRFDAVVCRHLLWSLPKPAEVLQRWGELLNPKGRLILIEGYWMTGAGLHASEIIAALPLSLSKISVHNLRDQSDLWGNEINDERYAIVAQRVEQSTELAS